MIGRFPHGSKTSLTKITHKSHHMLCQLSTPTRQVYCMFGCIKILEFPLTEIYLTSDIKKWLFRVACLLTLIAVDWFIRLYLWPAILASKAFSIVDLAKLQYLTVWSELTRALLTNRSHLYYMTWHSRIQNYYFIKVYRNRTFENVYTIVIIFEK